MTGGSSSIDVEEWAKCFYSFMIRSSEAKLRFAREAQDPVLKALMTIIGMDHRKVAEVLKIMFKLEETVDPFSNNCVKILGLATLENVREAVRLMRECSQKRSISEEDLNRIVEALTKLTDTTRGVILSLADVMEGAWADLLRYVASTYELHVKHLPTLRKYLKV